MLELSRHDLIAAPFTPMHPDGAINFSIIPAQAAHLAQQGVAGAFVGGTTGEGAALTCAERVELLRSWCAAAPAGMKIIAHVGHASLAEAQALARSAAEIGAHAFAAVVPYYHRPRTSVEVAMCCRLLAGAAPSLPFYLYHMPSMTGVEVPVHQVLPLVADVPNFAGVKFTFENLFDFGRCVDGFGERFQMLFGRDEILLAGLLSGAYAAVGSTYNFAAPLYRRLITAFTDGDLAAAQAAQTRARTLIGVMERHGGLPAGKAIMKLVGLDCGPMRPPMSGLSPQQIDALTHDLHHAGVFTDLALYNP